MSKYLAPIDPRRRPLFSWEALEQDDEAYSELVDGDYDPTPWCNACGAMRQQDCDCGPIADNE